MPTENAVEILKNLENEVDELVFELGKDLADHFEKKFGPVIRRAGELQKGDFPHVRHQPVSWQDVEARKQKYAPKWKGIRGLLKWLWKGHEEDEPKKPREKKTWPKLQDIDVEKMFPKWEKRNEGRVPRLTLTEYIEFDRHMDLLADEIIETLFKEQSAHSEVRHLFDRFREKLKAAIRRARASLEGVPYAPPETVRGKEEPTPTPPTPPGRQDLSAPPEVSAAEIARQTAEREAEEKAAAAKAAEAKKVKRTGDVGLVLMNALADAAETKGLKKPEPRWWAHGRYLSKSAKVAHEPYVLAWLIKRGVDIFDSVAVSRKLKKELGLKKNPQGDIAERFVQRLKRDLDYSADDIIDAYEKLGWKADSTGRLAIKNAFSMTGLPKAVGAGPPKPKAVEPLPEPEPEPEPEQTPEEHLRSIQAMFVEFGMREPEFVPCEDAPAPPEYSARLEFRVDENLLYRITCYALQKGGLHTIVTYSSGTLFEGYSRVRSFAAVQNHLAWHAIAVQDALGQRGRHVRPVRGTVELDPSLLSADYGRAPSPSAAKLREELEGRNDD